MYEIRDQRTGAEMYEIRNQMYEIRDQRIGTVLEMYEIRDQAIIMVIKTVISFQNEFEWRIWLSQNLVFLTHSEMENPSPDPSQLT